LQPNLWANYHIFTKGFGGLIFSFFLSANYKGKKREEKLLPVAHLTEAGPAHLAPSLSLRSRVGAPLVAARCADAVPTRRSTDETGAREDKGEPRPAPLALLSTRRFSLTPPLLALASALSGPSATAAVLVRPRGRRALPAAPPCPASSPWTATASGAVD
jgi:hypothetical protein